MLSGLRGDSSAARLRRGQARAFMLTFLSYASFHLCRKVPSVQKSVLHPQAKSSGVPSYDAEANPGWAPFNDDLVPERVSLTGFSVSGDGGAHVSGEYGCAEASWNVSCSLYECATSGALLARLPHPALPSAACPAGCADEVGTCWALLARNGSDVAFAQAYGGALPAPGLKAGSKAEPGSVFWQRCVAGGGGGGGGSAACARDEDLKVKPRTRNGGELLGALDSVFLACYTVGLFVSGYVGDHVDLRLLLAVGMLGSALCMMLFASAYVLEIHSMVFFVAINALFGLFQSMGWPAVVAVMASWFGHGGRGLVMGVWNVHTSVGNILGSVLAAAAVSLGMHHEDWPLGYLVPGLCMAAAGLVVLALLVPRPEDVDLALPARDDVLGVDGNGDGRGELYSSLLAAQGGGQAQQQAAPGGFAALHAAGQAGSARGVPLATFPRDDGGGDEEEDEFTYEYRAGDYTTPGPPAASAGGAALAASSSTVTSLLAEQPQPGLRLRRAQAAARECGANFARAVRIPGLVPFALSLMFSKMCAYSVLYWGPYYLTSLGFAPSRAGYLCSFFDLGGIVGGIAAGWLSDRLGSSGVVAFAFQLTGVPLMQVYFSGTQAAGESVTANALLMMLVGLFINAPYALITTAVSADLGQKVEGDAKLLALVTGIIDGTGSFGAMVQGVVVGHMSADSWGNVWHFLMLAQAASALMLVRLVERDVRVMRGLARRDEQR